MNSKFQQVLFFALILIGFSCKKNPPVIPDPVEEPQAFRLKELSYQGLPSPYYQFSYAANGQLQGFSWKGGARVFALTYTNNRIIKIERTDPGSKISVDYQYTGTRLASLSYRNAAGEIYKRAFLAYLPTGQLGEIEWEIKTDAGYVTQCILTYEYHPDGNLKQREELMTDIPGVQQGHLFVDAFSDYDETVNTDAFVWLQPEDEIPAPMPGIVLQLNNPRKLVRSGNGVNYTMDFVFHFGPGKIPLYRLGKGLFLTGTSAGQTFENNSNFSYYP